MFKPKVLVLDSTSGYVDLALGEQQGDTARAGFGQIDYGPLTGSWARDLRTLREINRRHGVVVLIAAHYEPESLTKTTGIGPTGKPQKDKEMIGWRLTLPGKGGAMAARTFDEVWRLDAMTNETGMNPPRRLYVSPHDLHDFEFPAKTRIGINKGQPLMGPTYETITKAIPPGYKAPSMIVVAGNAGVGKTTLLRTWKAAGPMLVLDMLGGWDHFPTEEGIRVIAPTKLEQVFETLRQVRDNGGVA